MTSFFGNQLQGYIGTYFDRMSKEEFFLMCAAIGAVPGIVFWLFNFPLKATLHHQPDNGNPVPETPFIEPER